MEKNEYILILIDSLKKKNKVLDQIIDKNAEQSVLVKETVLDEEAFQLNIEEKSKLIDELNFLDAGFETVYERVKDDLVQNKEFYIKEVEIMQHFIEEITSKSMKIQAEEQRNKAAIENHFRQMKTKVKKAKVTKNVALNYYKNMNRLSVSEPQFMDRKK